MLIHRFSPDQATDGLANSGEDANVLGAIDEMGGHGKLVELPIWKAHQQFGQHRGDTASNQDSCYVMAQIALSYQLCKCNQAQSGVRSICIVPSIFVVDIEGRVRLQ